MTIAINSERTSESSLPLAVSVGDTVRLTSLGRSTVAKLITEGRLQTVTIGRRRAVLYASIVTLLEPVG